MIQIPEECEFEKECEKALFSICPHRHFEKLRRECAYRKFAILVHNRWCEKTKEQLMKWGMPKDIANRTVNPLKMEED